MMSIYLGAYTGPSPASGYVGYVNISLKGDQVVFTVRPESADGTLTVSHSVPVAEAIKLFRSALATLCGVPISGSLSDEEISHMVSRFLAWKLPEHFGPDAGISFTPSYPEEPMRSRHWPIGTNLLSADQAEGMIRHTLQGINMAPAIRAASTGTAS